MASPNRTRALLAALALAAGLWGLSAWLAGADRGPDGAQGPPLRHATADPRVILRRVALGFVRPTDLQAVPGHPDTVAVLQKDGDARLLDLRTGAHRPWLTVAVRTRSEQGLLGLAFAPDFRTSGRFYLHSSPADAAERVGRVSAWRCDPGTLAQPRQVGVVLEVAQPYANHNAGQLTFGPDGMLYVGFGDGGAGGDPHGHGQNGRTLLGTLLRLDVDGGDDGYRVPGDNPFVDDPAVHDAVWALGLRNPWRFTFDPHGRLVVADVGQNRWEEVDLVSPGDNLGWKVREGRTCFDAETCPTEGLRDPVWTYGRDEGKSVTGGVVATGDGAPALRGRYLVGDFVSGHLWALQLPSAATPTTPVGVLDLGVVPLMPSTFGRLSSGDALVADFASGAVYRFVSPAASPAPPP